MENIMTNIISFIAAIMVMIVIYAIYMTGSKVKRIKRDIFYSDNVAAQLRDKLIKISKEQTAYINLYQEEVKKLNENIYTLQSLINNILEKDNKENIMNKVENLVIEDTITVEEKRQKEDVNFYDIYDKAVEDANRIQSQLNDTKIEFDDPVENDINFLNPKFNKDTKINYDDYSDEYISIGQMFNIMNGDKK